MNKFLIIVGLCCCASGLFAQTSPHGAITLSCNACHTTDSWRMRSDAQFTHASTGFDLTGVHKTLDCASCHQGLRFAGTAGSCQSCHTDIHRGELGSNCLRCHSTQSWRITDMVQRHQQTRFPLLGKHAAADCQACHTTAVGTRYVGMPTTCVSCHQQDFNQAQNPDHKAAGFSTDCNQCHQVNAMVWSGGFDHSLTRFPLTGSHRAVQCIGCHKNAAFSSTPTECASCHLTQYQQTTAVNHSAAGFSTACANCHTTAGWTGGRFDHNTTNFPLTGAHLQQVCANCHSDNVFVGKSTDCYVCHQSRFNATTNPNHVTGGFPHQCQTCHTTTVWSPSTFTHDNTAFPLVGAHRAVACTQCHVNNQFAGLSKNCIDCHRSDFNGATNPNHAAGGFSTTCTQCHSMNAWQPATFDHNTTKFALTGQHAALLCQSCHTNGNYQLAYTGCAQCHLQNYQGTTNPNHAAQGFSQTCETCHSTTAWSPASFDHSKTKFVLTGAHTSIQCLSCHTNGNYQLAYTGCVQCHLQNYQGATNPNHAAQGFSQTCETCHSTTAWSPSTFNHDQQYFKIYSGKHNGRWTLCTDCHTVQTNYASFSCTTGCHSQSSTDREHSGVSGYVYSSPSCYSCHRNV